MRPAAAAADIELAGDCDDFILLCEFECLTEQRGPALLWFINAFAALEADHFIPLQTESLQGALGEFILRAMTQDTAAAPSDGGIFLYPTDTQTLLSAIQLADIHGSCLAHHFALLDLEARGYVRPLSLLYVSRHGPRLTADLPVPLAALDAAVATLKAGACGAFVNDLTRHARLLAHGFAHTQPLAGDLEIRRSDIGRGLVALLTRFRSLLAHEAPDAALRLAGDLPQLIRGLPAVHAAPADTSEARALRALETCVTQLTATLADADDAEAPDEDGAGAGHPPPGPAGLPPGVRAEDVRGALTAILYHASTETRLRSPEVLCPGPCRAAFTVLQTHLQSYGAPPKPPSDQPEDPGTILLIGGHRVLDFDLERPFRAAWVSQGVEAIRQGHRDLVLSAWSHAAAPPPPPRGDPEPGPPRPSCTITCRSDSQRSGGTDPAGYATPPEPPDQGVLSGPGPMRRIPLSHGDSHYPDGDVDAPPLEAPPGWVRVPSPPSTTNPGFLVAGLPAGTGLRLLRDGYSWAAPAVFAVLSGWTAVVRGAVRDHVLAVVRALAFFVPGGPAGGGARGAVLMREDTDGDGGPVTLTDVAHWTVIGGGRGLVIPSALAPRCACLDLDEGIFTGPEYSGGAVDRLLYGTGRSWRGRRPMEEPLLRAHARRCLTEIAAQAAVRYAHLYAPRAGLLPSGPLPAIRFQGAFTEAPPSARRFVLEILGLRRPPVPSPPAAPAAPVRDTTVGHDADIVAHLCEVMAAQQQHSAHGVASEAPPPLLRTPRPPPVRMANELPGLRPRAQRGEGHRLSRDG